MSHTLPDGLVLRTARPADLDQIATLLVERGEEADRLDSRLMVGDPDAGLEATAVVVDGDRVVSTAMLLDDTLVLGEVPIPIGQVDMVATARDYEGRGLVRALMGWAHDRSAKRGHLAQLMMGIPYFYRLFGYQYAIPINRTRAATSLPAMPEGVTVRVAGPGDIPAMAALLDATQRLYDLRMPHSPAVWRWLVAREASNQLVAERDAEPIATGRYIDLGDEAALGEVAAASVEGAHALLAYSADRIGPDKVHVIERPGSLGGDALEAFLEPGDNRVELYYARVPDVALLLDHLRPVLSARLAAAGLSQGSGEIVISFFREHVRMPYADGQVGEVVRGGVMQSPGAQGGAGVAPDLVAPLLFGPYGIDGLSQRHPDVYAGPQGTLMRALFPPVRADILTYYIP